MTSLLQGGLRTFPGETELAFKNELSSRPERSAVERSAVCRSKRTPELYPFHRTPGGRISRSFFARCGIPQTSTFFLLDLSSMNRKQDGCPRSPNLPRRAVGRAWAENDGRSPTIAFAEPTANQTGITNAYWATRNVTVIPGSTLCPATGIWLNTVPAGSTVSAGAIPASPAAGAAASE
jgi:hypothetical protein